MYYIFGTIYMFIHLLHHHVYFDFGKCATFIREHQTQTHYSCSNSNVMFAYNLLLRGVISYIFVESFHNFAWCFWWKKPSAFEITTFPVSFTLVWMITRPGTLSFQKFTCRVYPGITGDANLNPSALKFFPVFPQKFFTKALAVKPKEHKPCNIGPFGKPITFAAFGSTCRGL